MVRGLFEDALLAAQVSVQGHHELLADRVYRGIRDLGEELLEIIVEHPRFFREYGQWCIVSHGSGRLCAGLSHGPDYRLKGLFGITKRYLPAQCIFYPRSFGFFRGFYVLKVLKVLLQPFSVRFGRRNLVFKFFVINYPAFMGIDKEHPARF